MFDAHLHLPPPRRWAAAREAGIRGGVLAGLGPADWQTLEEAAASGLTWSAGLHPWWVHAADDATLRDALRQLGQRLMSRGPVAIGECGLDFARARTSPARSRQHRALEAQLDMAREHEMPVVLHVVRATGAALGLVRDAALPRGGLVHGFAGPREVAMDWHRIGFCVGIGPALHRSARLRAAVSLLPRTALVVESDDADPAATLPGVVLALAALRREDPDRVARYTAANARRLFGLPGGKA